MDDLTDRLTRLAECTAPPPRADLARTVVTRHRARRRQTIGLTAVAAAVAAVVAVVPVALEGSGPGVVPAPGPAAPAVLSAGVLAGPTRGSLAGDAAFLEGVRQRPWSDPAGTGVPDPAVADRHVVFAGDVAGARWALVAGPNTPQPPPLVDDPQLETDLGALGSTVVTWFVGPPGATPEQMVAQDVPRAVDPSLPLAYADSGTGAVVVVAAPGDVVSVSDRPEVAADGSTSRTWTEVEAPDGIALLARAPSLLGSDPAFRYRVVRNGVELVATGPDTRSVESQATRELDVTWLRERPPAAAGDAMGTLEMASLLARTGLPADAVPFTVLWAGDVPAPTAGTARVTVFTATFPSGAVYVGTAVGVALEDGSGGYTCGSQLRPAGDSDGVVAAVCDVTDTSADSPVLPSLVVVAPPGAASVRLLDGTGGVLGESPLDDGVAVVAAPDGLASVETLDASGAGVERTAPLGEAVLE